MNVYPSFPVVFYSKVLFDQTFRVLSMDVTYLRVDTYRVNVTSPPWGL